MLKVGFLLLVFYLVYIFSLNFFEYILLSDNGYIFLSIRNFFYSSIWDVFGSFIHTKFFFMFVLFFPFLVCIFYFLMFLFSRFSFSSFSEIAKAKGLLVFFGFLYFFFFILLLQDFIFYTETYRTFFLFTLDDVSSLTILYNKK